MTTNSPTHIGLDDRIVEATTGTLDLFSIHLGRELGLYRAATDGVTYKDLARLAGIDARYAREWLEHQAVAGFVDVDDEALPWDQRMYRLNDAQVAVFVTGDHPSHVSPLADMITGIGGVMDKVAAAYRTGEGVPYAEYGPVFRSGQANVNRPAFEHDLVEQWIKPAVPEVARRLADGGRIADVGCGVGWSTIALGAGFPDADVIGYDSDLGSIEDAQRLAIQENSGVHFRAVDASALIDDGPFDLIVILEALHDIAQPVRVLEAARQALSPGGALVIADEAVGDRFTINEGELDQLFYGWSVVHCLPAAMAETPSAAIGTVIRPDHVRTLSEQAGFANFEKTDIDGGFFHVYVLS